MDVPLDGNPVYVRLQSHADGVWTSRYYEFQTSVGGTENVASLVSPVAGSTLDTTPVLFEWTVDDSIVDAITLYVGTTEGSNDLASLILEVEQGKSDFDAVLESIEKKAKAIGIEQWL